jgi:PhnB protein
MPANSITPSLAPWLTVSDGPKAVDFYKRAFGATETYRLEDPGGGLIVRLSIGGHAEFWISGGGLASDNPSPNNNNPDSSNPNNPANSPAPLGGDSIRLILTVPDPDTLFAQALAAGATQIFPVGEGHGWRLGRLADPFGLHWEIGYPLNAH